MATIELHFLHRKIRVRYGVMRDAPLPVYNGFVELESPDAVYHFRARMAFPVYKISFGSVADAIGLALEEGKALAKELLNKPDVFENLDIIDRGVFIYKYFLPNHPPQESANR